MIVCFTDEDNEVTESTFGRARIPGRPELITEPSFCRHTLSHPRKWASAYPLFNVSSEDQQSPEREVLPMKATIVYVLVTLNPEHFGEKQGDGRRKLRKGVMIPELSRSVDSLLRKEVVRMMSLYYIPR